MSKKTIAIAVTAAAGLALLGAAPTASASGSTAGVGLSAKGTQLVGLDVERPWRVVKPKSITGLVTDTALIGIDYRVQDRKLYGVGNQGGVYILDAAKGSATLQERPRIELDGSESYGVDFNPAANALRIVSSKGANLRVPFATAAAAIVDGPLNRPAVAPATGTVPATGVTAAAYTNNDLDAATATTLFVVDTERDQLALQSPANSGTTVATGSLGVDLSGDIGFDIVSSISKGKSTANSGYLVAGGASHRVNLLTGAVTTVGKLHTAGVTDIAIALR